MSQSDTQQIRPNVLPGENTDRLVNETSAKGEFTRQGNWFTTPFGDGPGELPVEAGRYRLIVGKLCPWAHRQIIVRDLLGLGDALSMGVVDPIRGEQGWEFTLDPNGVDPVLGIHTLGEAYLKGDPDFQGRATVPAVVDLTTGAVVNNDYPKLSNYFEVQWRGLQPADAPDLYPAEQREQIDQINDYVFAHINNGVYRAGFARTQQAYHEAYEDLFEALDTMDARLADRRFLMGDFVSDADVRLFVTLVRFDAAYHGAFHCNRNQLKEFANLSGYARDLFQIPGFGSTTNFDHIKRHYWTHPMVRNAFSIVPDGPDEGWWQLPPQRAGLSSQNEVFRRHMDADSQPGQPATSQEVTQ